MVNKVSPFNGQMAVEPHYQFHFLDHTGEDQLSESFEVLHLECVADDSSSSKISDGLRKDSPESRLKSLFEGLNKAFAADIDKRLITLVIPKTKGYLVRADILNLRMRHCELADEIISFNRDPVLFNAASPEEDAVTQAIGAIVWNAGVSTKDITVIHDELRRRLSIIMTVQRPVKQRTLALVEGVRSPPDRPGIVEIVYSSARSLGIDLIILDNEGHWAQDEQYADWRKTFVPIRMEVDDSFTDRIVDAVGKSGHQIDGIVTFCDMYMPYVAEAAVILKLPTPPPAAFKIATDKYQTSVFAGHQAYEATNVTDAVRLMQESQLPPPWIVKPCNGWCSEGVSKVNNLSELQAAFAAIDTSRHGSSAVIEHYCDGPEVDANFVLCDGEILFFEVSDDFPKATELAISDTDTDINTGAGTPNTWHELANVLPSHLPESELQILRKDLSTLLLTLGLRSGFYHLEARMQNSTLQYHSQDGALASTDLTPRHPPPSTPPTAWLIEINPRPPGALTSTAVLATYGIDYFALAMCFAIDDKAAVRALCVPFTSPHPFGAQFHTVAMFIPARRGGIFACDNEFPYTDMCARRPDLGPFIAKFGCFLKEGDSVPSPESGLNPIVAFVVVFSRRSRSDALRIAAEVRREFRCSIV